MQLDYIKMDWSLETPEERIQKVKEIIDNTPSERLTQKYLDKLSEYIVYPVEKEERKKLNWGGKYKLLQKQLIRKNNSFLNKPIKFKFLS